MSHTNSTTNYSLPQFIGTDKPAWLTDINGAFSTIDTNLKTVSDNATTAGTNATTANTNIGTLSNLTTTDKTNLVNAINENVTNIGTVSGVASQASSNATSAKTTAEGLAEYLTLTTFNDIKSSVTATGATLNLSDSNLNEAVNADGSVGKLYGNIIVSQVTSASGMTITIPTSFRPTSAIQINGVALLAWSNARVLQYVPISVATNGNVTITLSSGWYNRESIVFNFCACMLFMKDFGDNPVTPNA